ncbi:MAG: triose-phosphate isomerase [Owenweeksia sp.]|nr:triose-phosphate isomerase [Owenweeksia sp.]
MARKIIAGNWKMNHGPRDGLALIAEMASYTESMELHHVNVVIAPPALYLTKAAEQTKDQRISIAAQNCHSEIEGAYTGEVSAPMIKEAGVELIIIGHSERRQYFNESDDFLHAKLKQVLNAGIVPILCVGESLNDRKASKQQEVVQTQLAGALKDMDADFLENLVVAYEPVWAIGTGETATPEQAQEMHHFIRNYLSQKYHAMMAEEVSILYGGSVKPANAHEIFSQPDVDGGLVGGASLTKEAFSELIKIGASVLR